MIVFFQKKRSMMLKRRILNVNYVVEGSGMKQGDHVRLTVKLINAVHDRQIWSDTYYRPVREIPELQIEIAQQVAREIEAIITPEEERLITKIPTESQVAYELYLKAREAQSEGHGKGEELYRLALEYDSTFALPYVFLGWIYYHRYEADARVHPECLDSVRKFLQKALFYDDQLDAAYHMRGYYHRRVGEFQKAIADYQRVLELNPNHAGAYRGLAWLGWNNDDLFLCIRNFHKCMSLDKGSNLAETYRNLSQAYFMAGFREESDRYLGKALELDGDSLPYVYGLYRNESYYTGFTEYALELLEQGYEADSNNLAILYSLGNYYANLGENERSQFYFDKFIGHFQELAEIPVYNRLGVALTYRRTGMIHISDTLLVQMIDAMEKRISLGEKERGFYGSLARAYAILGEKKKAMEYLRVYNQSEFMNIYTTNLRPGSHPFIPELADEAEYEQMQQDFNDKFLAQQKQISDWLNSPESAYSGR